MNNKSIKMLNEAETKLKDIYKEIDDIEFFNSNKVLTAFRECNVTEDVFNMTTGYGYNDIGRDTIEKVYSNIFKSEASLVRCQFISGTHAISTALWACLRPGDTILSINGKPYDTLDKVIGLIENPSSLISFGVKYKQIDLINDDFDYNKIKEVISNNKIKLIEIQRSKGYSVRKSISIEKIEKVIKYIKKIDKDIIIMIDNCYCEFVGKTEPTEVGADLVVGSLIKNLGGGLAPNGGYITGRKDLIDLCANRLNVAGQGSEVGPSLGLNKNILQGLFFAPSVVSSALKTAVLTSYIMEKLGYNVEPKYNEKRTDIVQNIIFNDEQKLIKYCQIIQKYSPIDSNVTPIPWDMPGYKDKVIMAAGTFIQGSSIELSCDGPIREPYIAYQQGSLTYNYGKIVIMNIINYFLGK
ncbi:MAG: methionine gamma-lyase family protein [Bacilli bacterium]|nr:methionine gamma-lyase family protein [Bacilli bacterium]